MERLGGWLLCLTLHPRKARIGAMQAVHSQICVCGRQIDVVLYCATGVKKWGMVSKLRDWLQMTQLDLVGDVVAEGLAPLRLLSAQALYVLEPLAGAAAGDLARRLEGGAEVTNHASNEEGRS